MLEVTGTQSAFRDIELKNDDATNYRGGKGGTGIWTHSGEGCLFENVRCSQLRLAAFVNGANHQFHNWRGDQCYQILKYGNDSGGSGAHLFSHSKFVRCGNDGGSGAAVTTVDLTSGTGMSTFLICDWDESVNTTVLVSSDGHTFINCTTTPNCFWRVTGEHNRFLSHNILGILTDLGNDNEYWHPQNHYDGGLVVNGLRNLVVSEFGRPAKGTGIRRLQLL
jgi:hypothetical protein